ncbi:hypothetical protein SKAU_G00218380 [Synaphobranchus kaupii]|uniref:Uncharacterized protein n=1 Tax=Synaphobranchus kaupii TaxID=118154 RepID=A0A9Q1IVM4_SYNKA|nr:hypothetical protein SKAU_G00218380 [Synaphobranchus kaupii]
MVILAEKEGLGPDKVCELMALTDKVRRLSSLRPHLRVNWGDLQTATSVSGGEEKRTGPSGGGRAAPHWTCLQHVPAHEITDGLAHTRLIMYSL